MISISLVMSSCSPSQVLLILLAFYDQTDGVAMGSPLAPVLANLFMGCHEKLWLEKILWNLINYN